MVFSPGSNNYGWAGYEEGGAAPYVGFSSDYAGLNASSNNQAFFGIYPKVQQSGTAGYSGLLINSTETSVGSGGKYLIKAQVSDVSKFTVSNTGLVDSSAGYKCPDGTTVVSAQPSLPYSLQVATTATTTTSTASPATAVVGSMTVTPASGTWAVDFTTWCTHGTAGATGNTNSRLTTNEESFVTLDSNGVIGVVPVWFSPANGFENYDRSHRLLQVAHWQPLPQPPSHARER